MTQRRTPSPKSERISQAGPAPRRLLLGRVLILALTAALLAAHASSPAAQAAPAGQTVHSAGGVVSGLTVQATPTVSVASVSSTTATLTITGHTGNWSARQRIPGLRNAPCFSSSNAGGPITISSLNPARQYAFSIFESSNCTGDGLGEARFTTAGLVTPSPGLIVPENGAAYYPIRLSVAPEADVVVSISTTSTDDGDIVVAQSSLTFTPTNWSTSQTVTVAAAEDEDAVYGSNSLTLTTSTTDTRYDGLTQAVLAREGDNDVCSGTVAVGGSEVTAGGLVDDCNTLLAAKVMLAQPPANIGGNNNPPNWATTLAMSSWEGVTTTNQRVTAISLTSFSLAHLHGRIPNTFGDLTELTELDLHNNRIEGTIPLRLGNLTKLTRLNIARNDLVGEIPPELGNLTSLTELDLSTNDLTGHIPAELGSLTNLTRLNLGINRFTSTIPSRLGNLRNLIELDIAIANLTGTIPAELGNLTNLEHLYLNNNGLTGTIPTQLANLANLQRLRISSNGLTGTIPAELGNLSDLQQLYLHGNGLTGAIPTQLANLANLQQLYLSNNGLTGAIPTQLGNLADLQRLYLNGNGLTGTIPTQLGNLANLQRLYLNNNGLTGTIPVELGQAPPLNVLIAHGNNLSGCIPTNLLSFRDRAGATTPFSGHLGINHQIDSQGSRVNLPGCLGIGIYQSRVSVPEGSSATYTVRLGSRPYDTVQVILTTTGDSDITADAAPNTAGVQHSIDFTTANWNTPVTVRVAAAEDDDGRNGVATITHTARSPDFRYDGLRADVTTTEADDEPLIAVTRIRRDSATLTLQNHAGSWWLKRTAPSSGACKSKSTDYVENLASLTIAATYTYKAYSDAGCTTEIASVTFTTASPAPPPGSSPGGTGGTGSAPAATDYFTDDNGSVFEESINAVAAQGIAQGCNAAGTLFCPNRSVTRAEMAVFLQRALNLATPANTNRFSDSGGFAQNAIAAIAEAGITVGCNTARTLFCPNDPVSRAEMAVFLQRALNLATPANTNRFSDSGGFAQNAIAAIAEAGITVGCNTARTLFCPNDPVSRAEMATFLARALNL